MFSSGFAYRSMESVAIPVPGVEELHTLALVLCPRITVGKRRVKCEDSDCESKEEHSSSLTDCRVFLESKCAEAVTDKIIQLAQGQDGEIERR